MGHRSRKDFIGTRFEIRAAVKRSRQGVRVRAKLVRENVAQATAAAAASSSAATTASQPPLAPYVPDTPADRASADQYNDYTAAQDAEARRTKSQHEYQAEFLNLRGEYLSTLLAAESLPSDGKASCGHVPAWRCLSCHGRPTFCAPCCFDAHKAQPLHRVEYWQGAFFQPGWLRQVGVHVHGGHSGLPCPSLFQYLAPASKHTNSVSATPENAVEDLEEVEMPYLEEEVLSDCDDEDAGLLGAYSGDDDDEIRIADLPRMEDAEPQLPGAFNDSPSFPAFAATRMIVVVDTDGVHELPFTFCSCSNAPREDLQLLALGFYPATNARVRTVFTFRVLDSFSLANRECNTSARNFYNTIRRTTNSAFPHVVPDRYRELLRVSRQWRNLKMRKWGGFGHREEPIGPGELAVKCPACPHPGINLPEGWEKDPERWKYTRGVVLDGNFSAQHRPMKDPEKDIRLADGQAFTVADAPYKEHLATGKQFKEPTTCNDHRAVLNAAVSRGKYEATGIGAAACSRHGFFQPHACVDFQLGERQINMDYILNWILAFLNGLTMVLLLYDIMCQYYTRLHERFEKSPGLRMPPGLTFLRGIGQFHVHGHLTRCFPRFSLNFLRGVGVQDGEIIETLWNKINGIAGSTRGMGSAHRHELIDDRMNDSNWMKLTRIVPLLMRRWKRVLAEHDRAISALDELSGNATDTELASWRAEAHAAHEARDSNVAAMDLYDVHTKPAPTQKEVQEALLRQELQERDINAGGASSWISTGLRLEERKLSVAYAARQLDANATDTARIDLADSRLKLARAIRVFHTAGQAHIGSGSMPHDSDDPTLFGEEWDGLAQRAAAAAGVETDVLQPEHQALALPSTLGLSYLKSAKLLHLVDKELQLRQGQMNDSLQGIRSGIGYKSMVFRKKVREATSTREKLRSFDEVHIIDATIRKHVRVYMQARQACLRLYDTHTPDGAAAQTAFITRYRIITKDDLTASTTVLEAFTPGLRNRHEAWFWGAGNGDGQDAQWLREFRRSLWLRALERKERWVEERRLVPFEMECTVRFFQHRAQEWEGWGAAGATPGHAAYARRQADMWRRLAQHAQTSFAQVLAITAA